MHGSFFPTKKALCICFHSWNKASWWTGNMGGGREPHLLFTISLVRHFLSHKTYCLSFSPRSFLLATMSQLFRLNHRDSSMSRKLPWGLWCRRVTSLWPTGQTGGQLPAKQVCWVQGFWAGQVPSSLGRCYWKSLLIAGQTKIPMSPGECRTLHHVQGEDAPEQKMDAVRSSGCPEQSKCK